MKIARAFAFAMLMATTVGSMLSCENAAAPSASCANPPHTWDANVQRCRASNGQFATNACCGL
jgi:hypothetical protein